jgi:regulatory protein YycH of two-component signal transduction system YycFG
MDDDDLYMKSQLQEAALSALAALAKDNTSVASVLAKSSQDRESMYSPSTPITN